MGLHPLDRYFGFRVGTDVKGLSLSRVFGVRFSVPATEAPAASAAGVVAVTLGAEAQVLTENLVSPAAPRGLSIVSNKVDGAGNVKITGDNYAGDEIDETLALNGTTTRQGAKAFRSVKKVEVPAQVNTPTEQVETATVVGSITTSGNAEVVVTADGMTGSPKAINVAVVGDKQVETATVVGTIEAAGAGDVEVIVTAAGMDNSPKTVTVAVANDDTASEVAGKIRAALALDADVDGFFTITGSDAEVILTAKAAAANDATMNISIDNGTSDGLTAALTSEDTTAGNAPDDANAIAGKIRTALAADEDVAELFDVSGATDAVILTAKTPLANDATLNIAIDNGTCAGITTAATSANTTAGVAPDVVNVGWNDKLGLPYKLAHNTVIAAYLDNTLESTDPTVAVDADDIESNTVDLDSALDGTAVDIYLIV